MTPSLPTPETEGRAILTETFTWRGVTVATSYEPNWLNSAKHGSEFAIAHLEIQSVTPARAQLPITETGYLSHFTAQGVVEDAGGPAAYAKAWLDHAAESKVWKRHEAENHQLSLF